MVLERPVILVVGMEVAVGQALAEGRLLAETVVPGAFLEVAEAEAVPPLEDTVTTTVAQVEQGLEARCVYGPGSSEQRRTQRPGCAEA